MEILSALTDRLRAALAARPRDDAALTIGEIYLQLIPYRSVRSELGVLEFAAYEHGLLRLLAGEGGHVAVRDVRALEEIQRELASVNPILGIYRDYADAEVLIGRGGAAEASSSAAALANAGIQSPPGPAAVAPPADAPRDADPPPTTTPAQPSAASTCPHCREALPDVDGIRFCPFCGASQDPAPCQQCGALLDWEWNFCIRCGSRR